MTVSNGQANGFGGNWRRSLPSLDWEQETDGESPSVSDVHCQPCSSSLAGTAQKLAGKPDFLVVTDFLPRQPLLLRFTKANSLRSSHRMLW